MKHAKNKDLTPQRSIRSEEELLCNSQATDREGRSQPFRAV